MFWKLRYVDNIRLDDVNLNTVFGNAMHRVIQEWLGDILYAKSLSYARSIDLSERFQKILIEELSPHIKQENGDYLCSREEVEEYYQQGVEILQYVQQNSRKLFPTEDVKLFGIELELDNPIRENLNFTGYLDIVTVNIKTGVFTIYDLKTSRSGWKPEDKSNPVKKSQILLYKKFFAEKYDVPLDKVCVEYHILKRIVVQNGMYTNPRVSKFIPPHAATSINKTWKEFVQFIDACYDQQGNPIADNITPTPSKKNCKYCPFRTRKDLCPVGVS